MHCLKCFHENQDSAKFCAECGVSLLPAMFAAARPRQAAKQEKPPKPTIIVQKKSSLPGVLLVLFLLAIFAVVGIIALNANGYKVERQTTWLGQEKPIIDFNANDSGLSGKINLPHLTHQNQNNQTYTPPSNPMPQTTTDQNTSDFEAGRSSTDRVEFERGENSTAYEGNLNLGATDTYILNARAGQQMTLNLSSKQNGADLHVYSGQQEIRNYEDSADSKGNSSWKFLLPQSGDYVIIIKAKTGHLKYTFEITVE